MIKIVCHFGASILSTWLHTKFVQIMPLADGVVCYSICGMLIVNNHCVCGTSVVRSSFISCSSQYSVFCIGHLIGLVHFVVIIHRSKCFFFFQKLFDLAKDDLFCSVGGNKQWHRQTHTHAHTHHTHTHHTHTGMLRSRGSFPRVPTCCELPAMVKKGLIHFLAITIDPYAPLVSSLVTVTIHIIIVFPQSRGCLLCS